MKALLTIILIQFTILLHSQNWAVFNKNYRYNYSLQNENYTTVVIFADSVLTQGNDTIYSLNRIAAKCDSCWFYYPQAGIADSNYIMSDQPQFMQRRIVYTNNQYRLSDTSNYIIPRFLTIGNSWTFNAERGITAQVINGAIKNYYGVNDSVNTILLSTNDTIIISKQFGIIKYPAKFGQQIYYKLRGIETDSAYDINALYGEKVSNYYDFLKLKPGVIHYYSKTSSYSGLPGAQCYSYYYAKKNILSSSLTGTVIANSYIEDRKGCSGDCVSGFGGMCMISNPNTFPSEPINTYTYNNVITSGESYDQFYNSYNNQLVFPSMVGDAYIVTFGKTTNNHFYKTYGYSCFSGYLQEMKPKYSYFKYIQSSQNPKVYYSNGFDNNTFGIIGETFIDGYGEVNKYMGVFEVIDYYCTSAIIDGTDTLGEIIPYGIYTNINSVENNNYSSFGPNPTKNIITINFPFESIGTISTIEIKDITGKRLSNKTILAGTSFEIINLESYAQGIYFIEVKIPNFQKLFKVVKE